MNVNRINHIVMVALMVTGAAFATIAGSATTAAASSRVVVTGQSDIRVWLDDTRDVYPDYDDVVITLRATRDCYATVFVIDTDGYVHIVRPLSPWDRAWIRGGLTYRYSGRELGLARLPGRGIAHVFAISSPDPFDYSPYGEAIFAGHFGFRIYGDPFIASREIYLSLLPAGCHTDLVSVSFARFYIREWARYPGYLCRGHGGLHVRVGDYCRHCSQLYDGYRVHVADPYVVIHPRAHFDKRPSHYAEVKRSTVKYKGVDRGEAVAGWSRTEGRRDTADRSVDRVVARKSVVAPKSSSRVAPIRRSPVDAGTAKGISRPALKRALKRAPKSPVSSVKRTPSSTNRAKAPTPTTKKARGTAKKAR